jgi:hypothetical protein
LAFQPEPLGAAQEWIASQQEFWASRLRAIDDVLTAEDEAAASARTRADRKGSEETET